ncbi:MAG: lysine--tRNA ligase [Syntrophobacterales bacterium]|nr:lysine--tRNA ligase [Syntrophobacterales bacterium]
MEEENELLKKRREKADLLKRDGIDLYPNDVQVANNSEAIKGRLENLSEEELGKIDERFTLAGRIMAIRDFGKSAFVSIQDRKGRIQAFLRKNALGEKGFSLFKKLDAGDVVWIAGRIFKTKTGELSIDVEENGLRLLSKSLLPLPEKWHGLTDVEIRYRQRHLDLIVNPEVRKVFQQRSRIISLIRRFMEERDFLEVETPMMQPKAGGAVARPFKTFHNALGMNLFLRIAPELYLKRLITGGLERVFEINRNFRNEGISTFHNPEFTMMEFYQAYATYEELMTMTEELFGCIAMNLFSSLQFNYQGNEINLTPPWRRITVRDAVLEIGGVKPEILDDPALMAQYAGKLGVQLQASDPPGKVLMAIFDETVEKRLIQPTFVTHYPVEVSPLSRRNVADPSVTDRFELYIAGREIANAFSELNDPVDQRQRFEQQIKEREAGDLEAHEMDEDYIGALEYGMPPTAGEGIGIDRLVMLMTDSASIRDVILFPLLRSREAAREE